MPLIKEVISLDTETVSGDRELKVYALKNGSAASVVSVIANVLATELEQTDLAKKLTVTASADDRSLVVSGQPEDLAKVAELVSTLDAPNFTEVEVRSYRLPEGDTDDLAEALNNILKSQAVRLVVGFSRGLRLMTTPGICWSQPRRISLFVSRS